MNVNRFIIGDSEEHTEYWDDINLSVEAKTIKREIEHLQKKSKSRLLTYWEMQRLKEIEEDLEKLHI